MKGVTGQLEELPSTREVRAQASLTVCNSMDNKLSTWCPKMELLKNLHKTTGLSQRFCFWKSRQIFILPLNYLCLQYAVSFSKYLVVWP